MLATTNNLDRFLSKTERIIRNDYAEKGLVVCARIDNVFAISYNDTPFILSVNLAPFNVIVYSIALASDAKNYIIKSRGTCGNQRDVVSDIYVDLAHYVRDNNIRVETEKHYDDDTSEDVIREKEQYFDTDISQPNKPIFAKIENIDYCPNQNTCCAVSPFVNCNFNYKSEACIKAHTNFIDYCEHVHKQMTARSNPDWHHVSLAKLANIDFDMLDEKRKLVCDINQILKDGIRNLYKCENHIAFEVLERYVVRKCDELIRQNRLKAFWFSYISRQLDEVRRNTIYLYKPYITSHRNRW